MCLVLQCAVQLGIMGLYELRKEYVAKNLCVNRDKPKLHCNGKCHLKKQLKRASEQQEKEKRQSGEEVQLAVAFILPAIWRASFAERTRSLEHHSLYRAPSGLDISADIFHPPQA